ncbi:UvrD-helicase domain-containing protein [Myxococcota bacterium]|nr:UvrD-helicase domain-containing protein [Myxococcota bacterium]MBU1431003.1 UvrD-helicase domain-containing protein [Myxococcota bacterium]MBU1898440.1 UvrD-helicase domain-containing protein [Myxococcota bacterium]
MSAPLDLEQLPPDTHVVIEASAGTGKTYTIERIVVAKLLAGIHLENILVVTFTDKATTELQARIRELISTRLEDLQRQARRVAEGIAEEAALEGLEGLEAGAEGEGAPGYERLKAALFSFDRAPIYTIHAFCNRVLRELAFESGQLFEQEMVDTRRVFYRAWRVLLRERFSVEPSHRALLEAWLESGQDEGKLEGLLFDAMTQRYLHHQDDDEAAIEALFKDLEAGFDHTALKLDYSGCALQKKAHADAAHALSQLALFLARRGDLHQRLERLAALDLDPLFKPKRVKVSRHTKRFPDDLQRQTKRVLWTLRRLELRRLLLKGLERRVVEGFLPEIIARMERDKRRAGLLDYDDLLDRVLRGLQGPQGEVLTDALRLRFKVALIDEFQDTDERQWAIFRRIFVEEIGRVPHGQLYVIGDPKQAIYGFRGADIYAYLAARAELLGRGALRLPLSVNFRASARLTEALNHILDQRGEAPLFSGDIRYDEPVTCGRPQRRLTAPSGREAAPVVLWRFRPPPSNKGQLSATPLRHAFGRHLAETLSRLLGDPQTRLRWADAPITPKDIFVLVRERVEALEIAEHLQAAAVPYSFYKQDGLFQSAEARQIRDVLRAIDDPHDRARRLQALRTPFFGVRLAELGRFKGLAGVHPLLERLFIWRGLAEAERYDLLLSQMLHDSGLVPRARFYTDDERALTNTQHILELLLELGARRRATLRELIDLLERFIRGLEAPPGRDGNIQRPGGARDAVQIMTIHKSKGLEAPIVCLYGGYRQPSSGDVCVVHEAGQRRVILGREAQGIVNEEIERARREEDERLLYVALTRASARVYLPFIDSSRRVQGAYGPLNLRLQAIEGEIGPPLFDVEIVSGGGQTSADWEGVAEEIQRWSPPPALLRRPDLRPAFQQLREAHAPLVMTSYTRMASAARRHAIARPLDEDELKEEALTTTQLPAAADEGALPGGREIGRFLHEIIERLDLSTFEGEPPLAAWRQRPGVEATFMEAARRHHVAARWLPIASALIHRLLTRPLPIGDRWIPNLYGRKHRVEMELIYPIPEWSHPEMAEAAEAGWRAARGFIKAYVDYVFEHEGRVYFADWKSDTLPAYDLTTLRPHVDLHYPLQAKLYTLGVIRWLQIKGEADYEARFGGLLYLFLRGGEAEDPRDGVYFHRPSWAEVLSYDADLRSGALPISAEAAR